MMRRLSTGIVLVALSVYGGASASTSAVSNDALDDQAGDTKSGYLAASSAMDDAPVAVQVAAPPAAAPVPAVERTLSANPLWAMPLSQFNVTRERPIFSPSRRPPAPVVAPTVAPTRVAVPKPKEPERPQLTLVGTIAGDDEGFGIFLDQTNKAVIRLKVGETIQGWKLRSVQGRETTMEKDQLLVTLALPQPGLATPSLSDARPEVTSAGSDSGRLPSKTTRPRPN